MTCATFSRVTIIITYSPKKHKSFFKVLQNFRSCDLSNFVSKAP